LLEVLIRAGLILAMVLLCYRVFSPFLTLMVWALILAVTLYPLHQALANRIGGRQGLAATLLVAGVPWAGALAMIVLVLGVAQVPALIVTLPAIIYLWSNGDYSNAAAIAYTVLLVLSGMADNVLKPLMLGRRSMRRCRSFCSARWVAWRPVASWGCSSAPPCWRWAIRFSWAGWQPIWTPRPDRAATAAGAGRSGRRGRPARPQRQRGRVDKESDATGYKACAAPKSSTFQDVALVGFLSLTAPKAGSAFEIFVHMSPKRLRRRASISGRRLAPELI
jgi:hypothetical protein